MVRGRRNIQEQPEEGKKSKKLFEHNYDCTLKSVSIAKNKASVGVSISRSGDDGITVDEAEEVFCGAQLSVMLEADPNATKKEPDGQAKLVESTIEFEGIATCGGFGVKTDAISLSLQFVKSEVDLRQLGRFAALKGKVSCTRTGDSASDEDNQD